MPQAVVVAAIPAVAAVAGAVIQHKSQSAATKALTNTSNQALAHEREREAYQDRLRSEAESNYQRDLAEWKGRHGYGPAPTAGKDVHTSAFAQPTLRDLAPAATDLTGMASMKPTGTNQAMPMLDDLSKWNDWDNYLGA